MGGTAWSHSGEDTGATNIAPGKSEFKSVQDQLANQSENKGFFEPIRNAAYQQKQRHGRSYQLYAQPFRELYIVC